MSLRWGFLGASRIGRRALAPAVQAAGHTLHAVAARDLGRAQAFAAEFGAPRAYAGYDELIADPEVDAVYIGLTNDAHAPWTIRALDAGKPVLCEKPLAMTAAEVRQMRAAEQRSGRPAMEAFCHVFHPQLAHVQALLRDGAIGKLVAMQAAFGNPLERTDDYRSSAAQGGGALYDLGCYCVSLMRVLARREPLRVGALQAMRGEVDESFTGMLDFGDGLAAQFACSCAAARTQHLELIGSTGRLLLDWPISTKGRTTQVDLDGAVTSFEPVDPYVPMVEAFSHALAGGGMDFGLDWSLAQANTLDALFAAARTGTAVSVAR